MTYDQWKTMNPTDNYLGPEPEEETREPIVTFSFTPQEISVLYEAMQQLVTNASPLEHAHPQVVERVRIARKLRSELEQIAMGEM